jgi:hypothetical protein
MSQLFHPIEDQMSMKLIEKSVPLSMNLIMRILLMNILLFLAAVDEVMLLQAMRMNF